VHARTQHTNVCFSLVPSISQCRSWCSVRMTGSVTKLTQNHHSGNPKHPLQVCASAIKHSAQSHTCFGHMCLLHTHICASTLNVLCTVIYVLRTSIPTAQSYISPICSHLIMYLVANCNKGTSKTFTPQTEEDNQRVFSSLDNPNSV
jgi:hypothetical protein